MQRFRFTKTKLDGLPLPKSGARSTHYDEDVPKLAVRITAADTRTFYVVKRDGASMAWVKLGTFPEMTVEQARKAAERTLGEFARGMNPAMKRREAKKAQTLLQAYEQYRALHVDHPAKGIKSGDEIRALWERCVGPLPDAPARKHGRKRSKHPAGVDWSRRKLDAIGSDDVKTLHATIGRKHPTMANRVVELLSAIFNNAKEHGYPGDNPASGVKPFKETKRKRFIGEQDPDELPRFFKALATDASADFQHFVLLSLLTGARRTNVLSMRWQDINLSAAKWDIPDTKNDEPQLVALVPEAVEILRSRKPQDAGYVFPALSKTGYMTPPKKRWRALLKRAGVANLRVHDLRRSLGAWQAISGASLAIIGKSLGHKSADATMIYARLHLDPVRASLNTATSAMLEAAGVKKPANVVKMQRRKKS
ncbi:MAG TPA: tyrosine-type recombinase/integrase [Burkholderiales bacterium]|nr:tyrosine-type recombinase/integrase [Burkholderiales bacterium]